jgi:hypothetical protein
MQIPESGVPGSALQFVWAKVQPVKGVHYMKSFVNRACCAWVAFAMLVVSSSVFAVVKLQIDSVYADLESTPMTLTIMGINFDNGGLPKVNLSGFGLLTVQGGVYTATEIVAILPENIMDGDYVLTVTTNPGEPRTDAIDITIGATGATGPAGPQGPAGADGAQGPAGADGQNGADGATGPQGPQGEAGPAGADGLDGTDGAAGPQGPAGPAGADGADGVSGLELVTVRVPAGTGFNSTSPKVATAPCPGEKRVTGGGYHIVRGTLPESDSGKLFTVMTRPGSAGTVDLSGWTTNAIEANQFGETWALVTYAICATAP